MEQNHTMKMDMKGDMTGNEKGSDMGGHMMSMGNLKAKVLGFTCCGHTGFVVFPDDGDTCFGASVVSGGFLGCTRFGYFSLFLRRETFFIRGENGIEDEKSGHDDIDCHGNHCVLWL